MKFGLTAKNLWNLFQLTSSMSGKIKTLTLSFEKDKEQVEVMMEVSSCIIDAAFDKYFDDLMKKTLSEIPIDEALPPGDNPYKFSAKYFCDLQNWIEIMPKDILKSITITFHGTLGVELLVNMQDQVTLNSMQKYLQLVEEEDGMCQSLQRPDNYTRRRVGFLNLFNYPEILN